VRVGVAVEVVARMTAAVPMGRPREKQRYAAAAPVKPSRPPAAPSARLPGLVGQADAAAFVPGQVDQDAVAVGGDRGQGHLELGAAVAAQ
jgi:hypothetical protein